MVSLIGNREVEGGGGNAIFSSKDQDQVDLELRDNKHIVIYIFLAIALYNVIDIAIHIIGTFKRFRGLYCWSCVAATLGIALNATGVLMRTVRGVTNTSPWLYCTFILVGWALMVPGQSLVLYSRLHIVLHCHWLLRFVLAVIIVDAVCLGVPLFTLLYLENSDRPEPYFTPYAVFEKIQLTLVFIQEVFISACYIVETFRILRSQRGLTTASSRRIMTHLIVVNLVAIFVDASILGLEFAHHYDIQMGWKSLAYSIKLKMEFGVLNRLVEMSQRVRANRSLSLMVTPTPAEVDAAAPGLPLGLMGSVGVGGGGGGRGGGGGCWVLRGGRGHPRPPSLSGDGSLDGGGSAFSSRITATTGGGEDRKGRNPRDTFDELDF
ncbi:hypothetical protein ESCO_001012 [Escovopsis weberi]|uniref:DUF7703 domain-containing protein n=1 Tax=Escovopsis weberi TaxID=150374 RepID=A0A0M9VTH3_ESCWE|nr:hypothetical protein ESCO_001012 [Escovopsis weberi]